MKVGSFIQKSLKSVSDSRNKIGNLHITSIPSIFAPSIKPHSIILAIDYKLTLHNFDVLLLTGGSFFCIKCLQGIETASFYFVEYLTKWFFMSVG